MKDLQKTNGKQTVKGKFPPGNKIGNRFAKGTSGNPAGRPRRTKLTDALREQLAEVNPKMPELTVAETIARALICEAVKGNVQAAREIADRTEGKPKQTLDIGLEVNDWRKEAEKFGVSVKDVVTEAKLLIAESVDDSSYSQRD